MKSATLLAYFSISKSISEKMCKSQLFVDSNWVSFTTDCKSQINSLVTNLFLNDTYVSD